MWKDKLKLGENETIRLDKTFEKGSHGQEEVELYSILNSNGIVIGNIQFTDHTKLKGFKRTLHLIQSDCVGNIIVDEIWND